VDLGSHPELSAKKERPVPADRSWGSWRARSRCFPDTGSG
jgi:hypothetical protein